MVNRRSTFSLNLYCLGITFATCVCFLAEQSTVGQAVKVSLEKNESGFQLKRAGKPYYINGAGGEASFEFLAKSGGNSGRLWGVGETTLARLDEAHKNGISVALGIWLEHERHGFDYSDKTAVEKQTKAVLEAVKKYKDHPAVLVWGIGNEMEGFEAGDNPLIWGHIENVCQLVKKEDPNHPTMSVIAEVGGNKIPALHKHCPSLDIVGINSYGGSASVGKRYRESGGSKPYIVTEFGPVGTWEIQKNQIDAIEEPTSGEKAKMYVDAIRAFKADKEFCLGSYAFLWGDKQEGTPTWFGMLLPNGKKLAALDAVSQEWTGKPASNLCPVIESLELVGKNSVQADDLVEVKLKASDPEKRLLSVKWVVAKDADQFITGGDKQASPPDFSDSIKRSSSSGVTFRAPKLGGLYRVFAYVDDGVGAATANIVIRVEGKALEDPGKKVALPYVLYDEPEKAIDFSPSGFMGNVDKIKVDAACKDNPKSGSNCISCLYDSGSGWGGVVWQSPENDWGDKPGGIDVSGAKKLTFWVRGNDGDEKIKFGFGLVGRDKPYFDTAKKELEVELSKEWRQVTLDIAGMDLRRIKSGFFWAAGSTGKSFKFYLDNIEFK